MQNIPANGQVKKTKQGLKQEFCAYKEHFDEVPFKESFLVKGAEIKNQHAKLLTKSQNPDTKYFKKIFGTFQHLIKTPNSNESSRYTQKRNGNLTFRIKAFHL